jgi:hypothetical protein
MVLTPLAGAGMRLIVDLCKVLKIEMGIDLRGRDIGVPEQFLHSAQVSRGFEQMARKRVTKQMRMQMTARSPLLCPVLETRLDCARMDAPPT